MTGAGAITRVTYRGTLTKQIGSLGVSHGLFGRLVVNFNYCMAVFLVKSWAEFLPASIGRPTERGRGIM